MVIVCFDLEQVKEVGEFLFLDMEVDVINLYYFCKCKVFIGVSYIIWKWQVYFFDEVVEKCYNCWKVDLGNYEIIVVSVDKVEEKFLLCIYSDCFLGVYYIYDDIIGKLDFLWEVSFWIWEEDMVLMCFVVY